VNRRAKYDFVSDDNEVQDYDQGNEEQSELSVVIQLSKQRLSLYVKYIMNVESRDRRRVALRTLGLLQKKRLERSETS
jgi:hypothetical protein